ncbi:MAG TPA: sigma-E factor negative regulatory protein [Xylella sp.]
MNKHLSETTDKFELHTRLQLSQLIDGELPIDEARFLLRRLQHNEELADCQERWQLYGDVLRGVALAPAPADFTFRVHAALAAEAAPDCPGSWYRRWRWSSGVALAASVTAAILLTVHGWLHVAPPPTGSELVFATTAQLLKHPASTQMTAAPASQHVDASTSRWRKTTHNNQVTAENMLTSIHTTTTTHRQNPFTHDDTDNTLQTKPWPQAVIHTETPFNANFRNDAVPDVFYPFEPQLRESQPPQAHE